MTPDPSWPHAGASRIVSCPPHRWHVQEMGAGPLLLLLHGAGASTHSWRGLMPELAARYRIVALDLPGQGFTRMGTRGRSSLPAMAEDIAALLQREGWAPHAIIGHSAGAAIALWLARTLPLAAVVSINGALGPFRGVAGWLFPMLAKVLSMNPLTAMAFARTATPGNVRGLIGSTGSRIDAEGLGQYARLMGNRGHVDATLAMMAQWDVLPLIESLPAIEAPVLLMVGEADIAVPPDTADRAAARLPIARIQRFPGLGHLMHEERPDLAARAILDFLAAPDGA